MSAKTKAAAYLTGEKLNPYRCGWRKWAKVEDLNELASLKALEYSNDAVLYDDYIDLERHGIYRLCCRHHRTQPELMYVSHDEWVKSIFLVDSPDHALRITLENDGEAYRSLRWPDALPEGRNLFEWARSQTEANNLLMHLADADYPEIDYFLKRKTILAVIEEWCTRHFE